MAKKEISPFKKGKNDIFKRGFKAAPHPAVHSIHRCKSVLFRKTHFKFLTILILIGLVFWVSQFYWLTKCPAPDPCPELDCTRCPVQFKEIPVEKEVTVEKVVPVYVCEDGKKVNDQQDCNISNHMIEITHPDQNTFMNVTLAIDDIEWYWKDEAQMFGKISAVNFTVINHANFTISPKVGIRVWTENDESSVKSLTRDTSIYDYLIRPHTYWQSGLSTDAISFKGKNISVKLVLVNQLPDPDETIVLAQKILILNPVIPVVVNQSSSNLTNST